MAAAAGSGSDGLHAAVKPGGSRSGGLFVGLAVTVGRSVCDWHPDNWFSWSVSYL